MTERMKQTQKMEAEARPAPQRNGHPCTLPRDVPGTIRRGHGSHRHPDALVFVAGFAGLGVFARNGAPRANPFDSTGNGFARSVPHPARIAPAMHKNAQSRTTGTSLPTPRTGWMARERRLLSLSREAYKNPRFKTFGGQAFIQFQPDLADSRRVRHPASSSVLTGALAATGPK